MIRQVNKKMQAAHKYMDRCSRTLMHHFHLTGTIPNPENTLSLKLYGKRHSPHYCWDLNGTVCPYYQITEVALPFHSVVPYLGIYCYTHTFLNDTAACL